MDARFFVGCGISQIETQAQQRQTVQRLDVQFQQLVQDTVIPVQDAQDASDGRARISVLSPVVITVFAQGRTKFLV